MLDPAHWSSFLGGDAAIWVRYAVIVIVSVAIAVLVHTALAWVFVRAAARTPGSTDDLIVARMRRPTRLLFMIIGLGVAKPMMDLGPKGDGWWTFGAGLLIPALVGWLIAAAISAADDIIQTGADVSVADNLRARRRRTRAGIMKRIAMFVVLVGTICLMLMSIPAVRTIGVTLAASAGIGALAIGAAAQPALKNLIAGIQMAFTEPIRLDDVVIVDGEWGKIEEIRLTYVVVAVWDQRRLVVPVSKFLEDSFQNWTRASSDLLGTAFLHVDRTADVQRIREKLTEIVAEDPLWDGRVCGLQVTESYPTYMELRCLVSAADAGRAFDLRCNVRERMHAFLAEQMPEALPRNRDYVELQSSRGEAASAGSPPALPAGASGSSSA